MSDLKILHNPRCSKSRQTLQLLHDNGFKPQIIEYLKTPLNADELSHPKLIERPIVTYKGKAAIGRPPESVLDIL